MYMRQNPAKCGTKGEEKQEFLDVNLPPSHPSFESGGPLCHGGSQTWLQHLAILSSSKLGLASEMIFLRTVGASHRELKGMESFSSPMGNLNPNSGVPKIDSLQLWNNFSFPELREEKLKELKYISRSQIFYCTWKFLFDQQPWDLKRIIHLPSFFWELA